MRENIVVIPFTINGTAGASGSALFTTPVPLVFHSCGVYSSNSAGGSVRFSTDGTAQGTAYAKTEAAIGTVAIGTAAFGTAKTVGGTANVALRVVKNGTVMAVGTAAAAGLMYAWAAFFVDEFGGTVYQYGHQ